jgi:hypothetical protein
MIVLKAELNRKKRALLVTEKQPDTKFKKNRQPLENEKTSNSELPTIQDKHKQNSKRRLKNHQRSNREIHKTAVKKRTEEGSQSEQFSPYMINATSKRTIDKRYHRQTISDHEYPFKHRHHIEIKPWKETRKLMK